MKGVLLQVPAGPVVVPLALVMLVLGAVVLVRNGRLTLRRLMTVLATAVYGAAVSALTFFPLQVATGDYGNRVSWLEKANFMPVLTIDVRTFALNVVMFVPFGVLLPLWRRGVTWAVAARWGLALSATIEAGQWATDIVVSSGRTADVNDLLANTAGAVVGYWILRAVARSVRRLPSVDAWAVGLSEIRDRAASGPGEARLMTPVTAHQPAASRDCHELVRSLPPPHDRRRRHTSQCASPEPAADAPDAPAAGNWLLTAGGTPLLPIATAAGTNGDLASTSDRSPHPPGS